MILKTLLVLLNCQERAQLRNLLDEVKSVMVIGETPSGKEAFQLIRALPYELVFVDMELQDMNGPELVKLLSKAGMFPLVIFLSEKETDAAEAFNLEAADFLLKPIEKDRLLKAIERAKRLGKLMRIKEGADREKISIPPQAFDEAELLEALGRSWRREREEFISIQKLPVEKGGKHILIPYSKIIFAEAWGDYTYVYTAEEKLFTNYSLKTLEERFKGTSFFRVHRKYLVNLDQVVEIANVPSGSFYLRTTGKHKIEIPISRRRLKQLKEILGL